MILDFVNWIRVIQAFDGEILCMLMYSNISVKTRLKREAKKILLTAVDNGSYVRYFLGKPA